MKNVLQKEIEVSYRILYCIVNSQWYIFATWKNECDEKNIYSTEFCLNFFLEDTCEDEVDDPLPSTSAQSLKTSTGSSPSTSSGSPSADLRSTSLDSYILKKSPAQSSSGPSSTCSKKQKTAHGTGSHTFEKSILKHVVKTSEADKSKLDKEVGKYIFATNTSFRSVEHPQFKKMIRMMRPGYSPPSRSCVANNILNSVFDEELAKCKGSLAGQTVAMDFDGWSNIHNEPIICVSIVTENGDSYLVKTIDTSGSPHTSDYLTEQAKGAISEISRDYGVDVRSFVTDNAANMRAMRKQLASAHEEENDKCTRIIAYGCSAHLANLLAQDLDIPDVKSHIVHIVKHVRNTHLPAAKYKEAGGKKLILPSETRWNSIADCLEIYLQNWPLLVNIPLTPHIKSKVLDMNLKSNAEDLLHRLKPVAKALNKLQTNQTKISEAVEIWKALREELLNILPSDKVNIVERRYKQAIEDVHLLANMLDPRFLGSNLSDEEEETAMQLADEDFPILLPIILQLRGRSAPFNKPYLFKESVLKNLTPNSWWESMTGKVSTDALQVVKGFLTASASSASVERIFSRFGLVHSKIRNKLGVEKAAKLVFLYKVLNKDIEMEDDDDD